MKKIKLLAISFVFAACFFPGSLFGQSDADMQMDQCASNLGTYNYIKSFNINFSQRKKANSEYSYVFSKGSNYKLIVCDQNAGTGKMVINLYDREHKLLASTYDQKEDRYFSDILFSCEATGVYYISATFEGSKRGCGSCILGFDKE